MLILLMDAMKYCDGNDRDLIQKVREKILHFHLYRGVTVGKRRIHTPAGSSRFFFFFYLYWLDTANVALQKRASLCTLSQPLRIFIYL